MRELVTDNFGSLTLRVYPHLDEDVPDVWMAAAGYVEAIRYWTGGGNPVPAWGVRLNIQYSEPMCREESDQLQAAINRCWEWIETSRKEATAGR